MLACLTDVQLDAASGLHLFKVPAKEKKSKKGAAKETVPLNHPERAEAAGHPDEQFSTQEEGYEFVALRDVFLPTLIAQRDKVFAEEQRLAGVASTSVHVSISPSHTHPFSSCLAQTYS